MSKLSIQAIRIPPWMSTVAQELGCVKLVDPPQDDPWPGVQTIIRTPDVDALQNRFIHLGADGADAWWLAYGPLFLARTWAWAVEIGNEPDTSEDALPAWIAFTRRAVHLLHEAGLRAVVGNFAVGTPQLKSAKPDSRAWDIIVPALADADYLGLHEYGLHDMATSANWYALRHRLVAEELAGLGIPMPRVLITECGIDAGNRQGWKSFADNEDHYLAQLGWYNGALSEDAYVEAAYLYTTGPTWDWADFEITENAAREVASWGGVALLSAPPIIAESTTIPPEGKTSAFLWDGRHCQNATALTEYYQSIDQTWLRSVRTVFGHHTTGLTTDWHGQESLDGLRAWWRDGMGWDRGPHLVVAPDGVWVATPPTQDGIGVTNHNHLALHIECVGNYEIEPLAPEMQRRLSETIAVTRQFVFPQAEILPHSAREETLCPGKAILAAWFDIVDEAHIPMPSDETPGDMGKLIWFVEEATRRNQDGNTARVQEILVDMAQWLNRWPQEVFME